MGVYWIKLAQNTVRRASVKITMNHWILCTTGNRETHAGFWWETHTEGDHP
jgi:hypothetical protein